MSIKDLSNAWDEAALRALQTTSDPEIAPEKLASAAGLRVQTGLIAGYAEPDGRPIITGDYTRCFC